MRLPLVLPTEPRDATSLTKDSQLKNCFIDKDPNTTYIVKRPGKILQTSSVTPGTMRGIIFSQNKLYYITLSENPAEITF